MSLHTSENFDRPVRRQINPSTSQGGDGHNDTETSSAEGNNDCLPQSKRVACILCRKRKLKCNGTKPTCSTCSRLGHSCEYDGPRKKTGLKRGYVKHLETRLKQVETMLESLESGDTQNTSANAKTILSPDNIPVPSSAFTDQRETRAQDVMPDSSFSASPLGQMADFSMIDDFSWELMELGLEEALPNSVVMEELTNTYFEKFHHTLPMLHRGRFMLAMNLPPHMRPPVCLRYAVWALASSLSTNLSYRAMTELFYTKARKYAELDEMRGRGESIVSLAHCQTWTLLACHEVKSLYFPRSWLSIGRAIRLAQLMGLDRLDRSDDPNAKQVLPPARDWSELEERRRTFWATYFQDRYASINTGWSMMIDEGEIFTNLPASEIAFDTCQQEQTPTLREVMNGDRISTISSFSSVAVLATVHGRIVKHLNRYSDEDDSDINSEFWKRHRSLDNVLLKLSLSFPQNLRLPVGLNDSNSVFFNMNIHTATISLHQAAESKAEKHQLPQIMEESKHRCIAAANQVSMIMKMISHLDLSMMNPYLAFSLLFSARVFAHHLKRKREDTAIKASLQFLLAAMEVFKHMNPLNESLFLQLDVDMEACGLDITNTDPKSSSHFLSQSTKSSRPASNFGHPASRTSSNYSPNSTETERSPSRFDVSIRHNCIIDWDVIRTRTEVTKQNFNSINIPDFSTANCETISEATGMSQTDSSRQNVNINSGEDWVYDIMGYP